eukprot:scaffold160298_cov27-Prasinocladus_malaysianus.AAC.1
MGTQTRNVGTHSYGFFTVLVLVMRAKWSRSDLADPYQSKIVATWPLGGCRRDYDTRTGTNTWYSYEYHLPPGTGTVRVPVEQRHSKMFKYSYPYSMSYSSEKRTSTRNIHIWDDTTDTSTQVGRVPRRRRNP